MRQLTNCRQVLRSIRTFELAHESKTKPVWPSDVPAVNQSIFHLCDYIVISAHERELYNFLHWCFTSPKEF